MTQERLWLLVLIGVVTIGLAMLLAVGITPQGTAGTVDGAAMLTLIAGAAVGIERAIEVVWTVVGSWLGTWWPMNIVNDRLTKLTDELDGVVDGFYGQAEAALAFAQGQGKLTAEALEAARAELGDFKAQLAAQLEELKRLAPGSQRVNLVSASVLASVNKVDVRYGDIADRLKVPVAVANQSLEAASDMLATFKDNPGRRLISLWLGVLIGLLAAGWFKLDVFHAVLGQPGTAASGGVGVILTGFVIGFGSSPTHEVVRVLQEIKKSRKEQNTPSPQPA
jgi:hypothetical protein